MGYYRRQPGREGLPNIPIGPEFSEIVLAATQDEIRDAVLPVYEGQAPKNGWRARLRELPGEDMQALERTAWVGVQKVEKNGPRGVQLVDRLRSGFRHRVGPPRRHWPSRRFLPRWSDAV